MYVIKVQLNTCLFVHKIIESLEVTNYKKSSYFNQKNLRFLFHVKKILKIAIFKTLCHGIMNI